MFSFFFNFYKLVNNHLNCLRDKDSLLNFQVITNNFFFFIIHLYFFFEQIKTKTLKKKAFKEKCNSKESQTDKFQNCH